MTVLQKIIKYCAITLAICIIVSIIGGIVTALGATASLFKLGGKDSGADAGEMKTYEVSANVENLKIDLDVASLEIVSGEKLSVQSNLKNFEVTEDDGTLRLKEDNPLFAIHLKNTSVVLTVPEGYEFKEADISTGAGQISVDALCAEELKLEFGAGKADIKKLCASDRARIESGAGKVSITDGKLNDASIDMGTGKFDFTGELLGDSKIDFGVGSSVIDLKGSADEYKIKLDHGIGNTVIDGKNVDGDGTYGDGDNFIDIDGGVGSITINFSR